jgi:type IX secretion system PorP/SprF family membrane protein
MKRIYILAGVLLLSVVGRAQQLPLYSQYTAIPYLYNPAFAGQTEDVNVGLLHRAQWKGIPGAPTTSLLTADGPIAEKNIGLAATLFQDVTDITQRLGFYTSYSYNLKINEDQKVLFGLSLGFAQQRIDFSNSIIRDDNDPMLMYRQNLRKNYVDATLGVAYAWKTLEVGLSAPQLIGNKLEYVNTNSSSYYYMARHLVFSAKYAFDVNKEQEMTVYPLVLLRYAKGAPVQYDINAVFDWKKYGWAAITYKSNYAVGINIGVRLNNTLRAGYAYDFTVNTIKNYAGGAHEFFLGYTFGKRGGSDETTTTSSSVTTDSIIDDLIASDLVQKDQIEKLTKELENLKRSQDTSKVGKTQVVPENKGMQQASITEFTTTEGQSLKKGFYVVIGAYKSVSNAESAKASVVAKYPTASLIFNKNRDLHYVYVLWTDNSTIANEALIETQKEFSDAWVFDLK